MVWVEGQSVQDFGNRRRSWMSAVNDDNMFCASTLVSLNVSIRYGVDGIDTYGGQREEREDKLGHLSKK
jgi:hypothetical protein